MNYLLSLSTAAWGIGIAAILYYILSVINRRYIKSSQIRNNMFINKHVFITGGSSGVGLSMAKAAARGGGHVVIVARNPSKLDTAEMAVKHERRDDSQRVISISADVTSSKAVQSAVDEATRRIGRGPDLIVCSAGLAHPGYFLEQNEDVFEREMSLNYFGALYTLKHGIPQMLKNKSGGRIIFVSSALGLFGMCGYSQYCATKYAIRGLAESLRNEMVKHAIDVHIVFPSSIDTPGFEEEEKSKPIESKEIEGKGTLFTPEQVTEHIIDGVSRGQFMIYDELPVGLLASLGGGVAPRANPLLDFFIMPLLVLVGIGFRFNMDWIAKRGPGKSKNNN